MLALYQLVAVLLLHLQLCLQLHLCICRRQKQAFDPIGAAEKVVVFGGGSFGTAMGTSLAHKKADLDVVLLLRDPYLCHDINSKHINTKYLAVSEGRNVTFVGMSLAPC